MKAVIRQLERVRRLGRRLLFLQRLSQWLAVLVPVLLVLAVADYALRMPGSMRLILGVGVAAVAGLWLVRHLVRAIRFDPTLTDLALRAERMFPPLAGKLASAVEFHLRRGDADQTPNTSVLAAGSIDEAERLVRGVTLKRLVDPTRTLRLAAVAALIVGFAGTLVLLAPGTAYTAAMRYLAPFGDAAWPKRQHVQVVEGAAVYPIDVPARLQATVAGYHDGIRVRTRYRVITDGRPGPWESLLLTRQNRGAGDEQPLFEALVELPWSLRQKLTGPAPGSASLEYVIEAGDDASVPRQVRLGARPEVTRVVAELAPPAYATGLVSAQTAQLHEQPPPVATASAFAGSTARLSIGLNKPLPGGQGAGLELTGLAPDAARVNVSDDRTRVDVDLTLRDSQELAIKLTDADGLSNLSDKLYRLEALVDAPPAVSLTEPAGDLAVLPTAVLEVAAMAQDDVGVERLTIDAAMPDRDSSDAEATEQLVSLAERIGRSAALAAEVELDLSRHALQPGDTVTLTATAEDGYALGTARHEPVTSAPRVLRIIDAATLVAQIRTELAAVRQQATRIDQAQQRVQESELTEGLSQQQGEVHQRMEAPDRQVQKLQERAAMNRLQELALGELMSTARRLLEEAGEAARAAERALREAEHAEDAAERAEDAAAKEDAQEQADAARARAAEAQQEVRQKLSELTAALDQGAAALALKTELSRIASEQDALAQAARKLLPRTAGRDINDLPEDVREQLEELARSQDELAQEAEQFADQARATANQMRRQGQTDREQASADVLDEVADLAERRGLTPDMQQAAEASQQNRLSQAGQSQMSAQQTLSEMAEAMGRQAQRQREVLRRRLAQLAQLLERLIERQEAQVALLDAADPEVSEDRLIALAEPQLALRQATMAAQDRAAVDPSTQEVASMIGEAIGAQARAVKALRDADRARARVAEGEAVTRLTEALERVRQQQREAQDEQNAQQREKLRKAYEALAERQDALRERVEPFAASEDLDRRQRAEVRGLAEEQAAIGEEAAALGEQVADTLVFRNTHERIEQATGRAERQLRAASADELVVADQRQAAYMLRAMAEALEPNDQRDEFQDAGGGGGGGGSAPPPPLVPDLAELKLLRSMQEMVYDQTRAAEDARQAVEPQRLQERLEDLGGQQRTLHELGRKMLEKLKKRAAEPEGVPHA